MFLPPCAGPHKQKHTARLTCQKADAAATTAAAFSAVCTRCVQESACSASHELSSTFQHCGDVNRVSVECLLAAASNPCGARCNAALARWIVAAAGHAYAQQLRRQSMAPSHAHLLARRAVLSVLAPAVQQLRARDAGRRQDVLPGVEVRRPALPLAVVPAPERHHAPADVYGPCQRGSQPERQRCNRTCLCIQGVCEDAPPDGPQSHVVTTHISRASWLTMRNCLCAYVLAREHQAQLEQHGVCRLTLTTSPALTVTLILTNPEPSMSRTGRSGRAGNTP